MAANTYTLINSNVLSSSAASVTFSSIPTTYRDLVLKTTIRLDNTASNVNMGFNTDSGLTRWNTTYIRGNGSTVVTTTTGSGSNEAYVINANISTSDTSMFSNDEIYIPDYSISSLKQTYTFSARDNNTTGGGLLTVTSAYYSTATIVSTLKLLPNGGVNFAAGSSFYLYGIKNS
jgi:hypothetical protein